MLCRLDVMALEKKLSIRFPGFDIDQLHSQLLGHEFLHVVVIAKFHRPTAKPVANIGKITHAAVLFVFDHIPKHFSECGNFVSHLEPPDIPPFHFPLFEYRSGKIPLLYIEPELRRRVLLNVRGVESDVVEAALFNRQCGVPNRSPDVSGVVQYPPGIDDIRLRQGRHKLLIENRGLHDFPILWLSRIFVQHGCGFHGFAIIVEAHHFGGPKLKRA